MQASWEQKISDRVYNVQKGCKKKDESPPASKRPRLDLSHYPPLDEGNLPDDTTFSRHMGALDKEMANRRPKSEVVLELMELTYGKRRIFVTTCVQEIVDKYPARCLHGKVYVCVHVDLPRDGTSNAKRSTQHHSCISKGVAGKVDSSYQQLCGKDQVFQG